LQNHKSYTGVGSRFIPEEIHLDMVWIAKELCKKNYILRSGGADGADTAFEDGCNMVNANFKEIYLPYENFNYNKSERYETQWEAYAIAQRYHPIWNHLPDYAKKFHARNVHQVLGDDVTKPNPSSFLICWTKDGVDYGKTSKDTGGTGTAIRIAQDYGVKIINLKNTSALYSREDVLKEVINY
jgi:hypothetical protein